PLWLVDERSYAAAEGSHFQQFERRVDSGVKEALALAHQHRVDQQADAIYQTVLDERLRERAAAMNGDVCAILLLEFGNLFHDVIFDDDRVVPLRFVQRG